MSEVHIAGTPPHPTDAHKSSPVPSPDPNGDRYRASATRPPKPTLGCQRGDSQRMSGGQFGYCAASLILIRCRSTTSTRPVREASSADPTTVKDHGVSIGRVTTALKIPECCSPLSMPASRATLRRDVHSGFRRAPVATHVCAAGPASRAGLGGRW